jgi:hypothetical protein
VPTVAWVLVWLVVPAVIAFFAVREIRSGRKQPPEFDRFRHEATREAEANLQARGPSTNGTFFGS